MTVTARTEPFPDATSQGVLVKSTNGRITFITPVEYKSRFGVQFTPRLIFEKGLHPPMYAGWSASREIPTDIARVRNGETADLYIGHVNDQVGYGVFANSDIAVGEVLGEYTGLVRRKDDGDDANRYLFNYGDEIVLDAKGHGNMMRFANHSVNHTNAKTVIVYTDNAWHIVLVAIAPILKDQQVLYNYGCGFWSHSDFQELAP